MSLFGHHSTISHEDSRINGLQLQQSTYGCVIPVVFGTNRIAGNLLDYIDFTAIAHTTTQRSGGKGGGGVTSKETTYTYTAAVIIGLGEGPIPTIGKVWKSKESGTASGYGFSLFSGASGQHPWGYMTSTHPERALYYPKTAYIAAPALDLGSNAEIPEFNFEVYGRNIYSNSKDAVPDDIIRAILSDAQIGVSFPAAYIPDWSTFRYYCIANGIMFSPAYTSQEEAQQLVTDLCQAANAEPVWTQGKLKIVPYGTESITANGVTFTPEQTEIPDIGPDDFVYEEGQPPVVMKPNLSADRFNIQSVEIMNRENDYNIEPVKATDDPDIGLRGPRSADAVTMHFITQKEVGQFAAQSILQRQLYVPNQYEFTLTWRHCLLDSMDQMFLTEPDFLDLDHIPVRVVQIEEDESFNLKFTCEDCPEGIHTPALYSTQSATRPIPKYNIDPGSCNTPAIFEPPAELTTTGYETWIAADGGSSWGGASVWVSDDEDSYKRIGRIVNPARYGTLVNAISASDTSITIQLNDTNAQLQSGTAQDAQNLRTVCWVDGEAIAYTTATLVAAGKYNLSGLVRGAWCTPITSHAVGSFFVRCDDALFKYPFEKSDIGKKIYIKLTAFNIYGNGEQSLADVEAYEHTLNAILPNNVTDIEFAEHFRDQGNGVVLIDLQVTFTPPDTTAYTHSEVYYKSNNPAADELLPISDDLASTAYDELANALQGWKYVGNGIEDITIPNMIKGDTYMVRVVAVTKNDLKPEFDTATTKSYTIQGKTYQPYPPTGLTINITDIATVSWDKASQTDVDFSEIRTDQNPGTDVNKLFKTTSNKAIVTLPTRSGTLYVYHHNTANKYSTAAYTTWNKPAPTAPMNVKVTSVVQGFVVSCDALPKYCSGINIHVNNGTATTIIFSPNNTYKYPSTGGIYDVQVAYVDLFGEGALSAAQEVTVKAYIDTALLAAEVQSLATNEKIILDGVAKANAAATQLSLDQVNTSLTDAKNRLSTVEGTVSTNSTAISNLTTEINLKADQTTLDALTGRMTTAEGSISTQAGQIALKANQNTVDTLAKTVSDNKASLDITTNGIMQTVTSNKATQDGINSSLSTQINTQAGQITQITSNVQGAYSAIAQNTEAIQLRATKDDVNALINISSSGVITIKAELLDITAQSHFANGIIAEGMIQSKAVTADKMSVESLSAITATIGTLRTATTGARTEISDNLIKVYDANNVLRVRMGVWS